jgi:hypothetical protein
MLKVRHNLINEIGFNLMTDDSSGFESIIKEMNSSQQITEKSANQCHNINCKSVFMKYEVCKSCNRKFCEKCLCTCSHCSNITCLFCARIDYTQYEEVQICPNC